MREGLKQSLLADGFGDGSDPHCLLIPHALFEKYWAWAMENHIVCRPVSMGETIYRPKTNSLYVAATDTLEENPETNDIHNSTVVYIPDRVKYCFAKLRWS